MQKNRVRSFLPITIFFIALNSFFITGKHLLEKWGFSLDLLVYGNLFLFAVTVLSYIISVRGLHSSNPHAFVRSIYGSIMVKMFLCLIAAFIYIYLNKGNLNKPGLFFCMGLYMIYTFTEVSVLTKLTKQKPDA